MPSVRAEIEAAAKVFANAVFEILRHHSINDLVLDIGSAEPPRADAPPLSVPAVATGRSEQKPVPAPSPTKRKNRARRSPVKTKDVSTLAHRVIDFVTKNGATGRKGLLEGLGVGSDELQKALAYARGHQALTLQGEKRNAVYATTGRALPLHISASRDRAVAQRSCSSVVDRRDPQPWPRSTPNSALDSKLSRERIPIEKTPVV